MTKKAATSYKDMIKEMTSHSVDSGLQQIYNIGDPDRSLELRFEKDDTECLVSISDGTQTVRVWLSKKEIEELDQVANKAKMAMK